MLDQDELITALVVDDSMLIRRTVLRAFKPKQEMNATGYRVFNSYLDGYQALLFDLRTKINGESRTKLEATSSITDLVKVYRQPITSADYIVKFLRQALADEGTPGQLFKNMLGGLITGMAGGAGAHNFAEGFSGDAKAEMAQTQQRDLQARQMAQQNFENLQAQQALDAHTMNQARMQMINLQNIKMAHDFDFDKQLEPLKLGEAQQTLTNARVDSAQKIKALGLTNPKVFKSYDEA